ncbi:hypothetical protein THAOC_07671, partial [Thalassiosira oceanica]
RPEEEVSHRPEVPADQGREGPVAEELEGALGSARVVGRDARAEARGKGEEVRAERLEGLFFLFLAVVAEVEEADERVYLVQKQDDLGGIPPLPGGPDVGT